MPFKPEVIPSPRQDQGSVVYRIHDLLGGQIDLTPDRRLSVRLDTRPAGALQRIKQGLLVHVIEVAARFPLHQ